MDFMIKLIRISKAKALDVRICLYGEEFEEESETAFYLLQVYNNSIDSRLVVVHLQLISQRETKTNKTRSQPCNGSNYKSSISQKISRNFIK
ncbi:hypothetical protein L1887_25328 [Cichorium endivia]|nr:hypothetical protein L1887_25328 [Cichorium endivia]